MIKLCEPKDCTGCFACYNSCAHKALNFLQDNKGFYAPQIDETACTECGFCEKKCPVLHPVERIRIEQYGYACWSNDKIIRKESSSGGLFTEVARIVLAKGGMVVGAAFDNDFVVRHTIIDNEQDLADKLRGSKYVQSHIGDIFKEIKRILKDRIVLFSGTPCQIAGLYSFLGKEYENLYTMDLICHGVPSPVIFEKYKQFLTKKYKIKKIDSIKMRYKKPSWTVYCMSVRHTIDSVFGLSFEKKEYIGKWHKDPYLRLFLRDYILHESCYDCKYTNMNRMGDVTMADFWGFKAINKHERNTDEGISLALINTEKGENLFGKCKSALTCFERDAVTISKSQKSLSSPWAKPEKYEEFWQDFERLSFEEIIEKYGYAEPYSLRMWLLQYVGMKKINIIRTLLDPFICN